MLRLGGVAQDWRLTEEQWLSIAPIAVFWVTVGLYEAFDALQLFADRQLQPTKEEISRNRVKKVVVFRSIIWVHLMQLILGLLSAYYDPWVAPRSGSFGTKAYFNARLGLWATEYRLGEAMIAQVASIPWGVYLCSRQLAGFIIMDTYIYWLHVLMHKVPWLYRNIHSRHHQLYTPYALAAQYNHICETLFSDIGAALLSTKLVAMSPRESAIFYALAVVKQVDDHSGYQLLWNPLTWFGLATGNGPVYHSVHHQPWGIKVRFFPAKFGNTTLFDTDAE
ncbi:hypothetical protein FE257_000787 [Aspergillus nanangensis]|uniref:Fatty acid hydroxylase domain-containing protein n=1 Tax=Aspergillus nanangensis TaxID=2582783 RepID=A0AAD4GQ23_ASPNN|nr:hypothetical protein FE257_000787 [Aspergillus nanangensis]